MIECRDLRFAYGDNQVLQGVTLSVASGEFVALLGPSGSGKSTMLYCLAGVLTPSAGRVLLGDVEVTTMSDRARTRLRAEHFGFVLQFGRLVGELTAAENASIPLRLAGRSRRDAEAAAALVLDDVGVGHLAKRKAASLSGGEQQRVAVARALVHRPAVVFADEPTGALDSANGAKVVHALTRSCRDYGATLVLVTHDVSLAALADRQVYIRDGVVEADVMV